MSISRKRVRDNFNRYAEHYDAHAELQHEQTKRLFAYTRQMIPPHAAILDIGCGTGKFARLHHELASTWRITGVDLAEKMCRLAQAHQDHTLLTDAIHLPFSDNAFEGVVSSLCLQWVEEKTVAFSEIQRVLRPGGQAIIIILANQTLKELREAAVSLNLPLALLEMVSGDDYKRAIEYAGLELLGMRAELEIRYYDSAKTLLGSMKKIGASHANAKGAYQAITPRAMMQLLNYYESTFSSTHGVFATWQPVLFHLKKSA